jgi:hypothetical protein
MLDALLLLGGQDECGRRLDEFRAAGVKTPILLPMSLAETPEARKAAITEVIAAMAPE